MKYLIISEKGDYLPIAYKLKQEGKEVYFYIIDHTRRNKGKKLVPVVESYKDLTCDIAILDTPNAYNLHKRMKGEVFGYSEFTDLFSRDKNYFLEIARLLDIPHNPDLIADNGIEGWFNGKRFVLPVIHHKYYTKFFNDDIGDNIAGGTGVVSVAKWEFNEKYKGSLGKLEETLKRYGYRGLLRLDYSGDKLCKPSDRLSVPTLFELLDMPLNALIEQTVKGRLRHIKMCREKTIAVRVSIPPYPYCCKFFWGHGYYKLEGQPLYDYDEERMKHLWVQNVFRGENGSIVSSGHSGDLGFITARAGLYLSKEGNRRVLRTARNLGIHNLQYRTDIV